MEVEERKIKVISGGYLDTERSRGALKGFFRNSRSYCSAMTSIGLCK